MVCQRKERIVAQLALSSEINLPLSGKDFADHGALRLATFKKNCRQIEIFSPIIYNA